MNIQTRAFLIIFAVSSFLVVGTGLYALDFQRNQLQTEYIAKYDSMMISLSNTLKELESASDRLMRTSMVFLKEEFNSKSPQGDAQLKTIAQSLGVSDIFITDKTGKFIRATNGPIPQDEPNLFQHCADYRQLTYGQAQEFVTPFITVQPEEANKGAYKFLMAPSQDRNFVLEVGLKLEYIGRTLTKTAEAYPELDRIALVSPSGKTLGSYSRKSESSTLALQAFENIGFDRTSILQSKIISQRKVSANAENCCECRVKGLVSGSHNNSYFYILQGEISKAPFENALRDLTWRIGVIVLIAILFAALSSHVLSKLITGSLREFISRINLYMTSKVDRESVIIHTEDEIGFLSKTFASNLGELEKMNELKLETERLQADADRNREISRLAAQVSHDIRSPLSALNLVVSSTHALPESERLLIRNATQRINDIANSLLGQSRKLNQPPTGVQTIMLVSMVDKVVSEKRVQYRDRSNFEIVMNPESGYGLFSRIKGAELARALSNLIDNAADATKDGGFVRVDLMKGTDQTVQIVVEDNGVGIDKTLIPKLGQPGASYGKEKGNGLGVYQVKKVAEEIGGRVFFESALGQGTKVTLELPGCEAPAWFVEKLNLKDIRTLVSVDDDQTVHQVWQERIRQLESPPEHLAFNSGASLRNWLKSSDSTKTLFLVDYEFLGQQESGIDLIESLNIQTVSILVTSRYDEAGVQQQCARLRIRIIPKTLAATVPFYQ